MAVAGDGTQTISSADRAGDAITNGKLFMPDLQQAKSRQHALDTTARSEIAMLLASQKLPSHIDA
jgi:hypothetical protein